MLKATLRSAVLLALIAIGMAMTAMPSFAEVQNVKVGGDITIRAFMRDNLDLRDGDDGAGGLELDGDNFVQETTGVNIAADLTENVSTFVRIANESLMGGITTGTTASSGDLDISQGWIKLKDLFYAPLTVTLGRQPVVWGRGFVLGSNLIPGLLLNGGDRNAAIVADEFTDFTAFDGFRATLDFSGGAAAGLPLMVDMVYLKEAENTAGVGDDVNLLGINIGTHLSELNSEMETYYLNKRDKGTGIGENLGSVSTIGVRGSAKPAEGVNTYAELAYQFGRRGVDPSTSTALVSGDAQQAWAVDLGLDFRLKDLPASPMLGGEWIFWSGKDSKACTTTYCGGVQGWDPIARGYFTTALREFQTNSGVTGFYPNRQVGTTSAATNQHQLALYGSLKPFEDLTIAPRLTWFILDKGIRPIAAGGTAQAKRKSYAGMEWDTVATYNYTDDVQFQMIYGIFAPGNIYRTPNDHLSQELVSSVSVKF